MIISASRRTDISAFYSKWFINRINEGYVYVKNPMNSKQISKISLKQDAVDCIVFWTKNAAPMIEQLDIIDGMDYKYYFLWTITPYGKDVECNLPDKIKIMENFMKLSDRIGNNRIIWRYDPVIVSSQFSVEYHVHNFEKMCRQLQGFTNKCIFSYVDLYNKIRKSAKGIISGEVETQSMLEIAQQFSIIAKQNSIILETCCEQIELSQLGIKHSSCINKQTVEEIIGCSIEVKKAKEQRCFCSCIESIDIGAYNCCSHGCIYCYANVSPNTVLDNIRGHEAASPLLIGRPQAGDKITERVTKKLKNQQISLLDFK